MSEDTQFHVSGVDAASGQYLLPALPPSAIAAVVHGETLGGSERHALEARFHQTSGTFFGVAEGIDPGVLAETGWGVVFAQKSDPAIRVALGPLLDLRRSQATARDQRYYRELVGDDGYRTGQSLGEFLVRHHVTPGQPANPERLPYYLLLVGDPEAIPFRFQYLLDVVYAVGRLHFDSIPEYANYAANVVSAETAPRTRRRAAFFGVRNPDDRATGLSADLFVGPLARHAAATAGWSVEAVTGESATKGRLADVLGGAEPPSLLLAAGHGIAFPLNDPRQRTQQGALLCQDWPGPKRWSAGLDPSMYFAGDDVGSDADLTGLVAFLFACYGAGTPRTDDFALKGLGAERAIAPQPFIARLPQVLLGRRGGALAVIGHVDRAWAYSFFWPGVGDQLDAYDSVVRSLLSGAPVGRAVEYLNDRYAALTTQLESEKEDVAWGKASNDVLISSLWTARNDARNTVILGDPAVRLPSVAGAGEPVTGAG